MFLGEFRHQLDGKGRVAVPAQFRRGLPPGSVIAYGPEGRLVIRPPEEWAALERQHKLFADGTREERAFRRRLYSSARPVDLDGQGRLLIHPAHRDWAHIADRAVFVGLGDIVEVVGESVWDQETASIDQAAFTELNDRVTRPAAPSSGAASSAPA